MALKRWRNCLPLRRTMSAISKAGRVMGADYGRRGGSDRCLTASTLRVVGDLMQMLLGQMQISGRSLQILMTEQQLYGAQVGAGFQQMCGPAVPNQMGAHPLTNPGFLRRLGACMPHSFVADRLLVIAMHARGEQVGAWF